MQDKVRFGRFEVLVTERKLTGDGVVLSLGARAFELLVALVERRDRLVTKAELLDVVWPGLVVEEANIQVQVSTLRRVLGADAIATVPGLGYRFALAIEADGTSGNATANAAAVAVHSTHERVGNLPSVTRGLIGREGDIAALIEALERQRLLTVLGPGGIGKTSVAQEVARLRLVRHSDGVWWVDLGALASADHLATVIANAAHLPLGDGSAGADESLCRALASQQTLLVLDNAEHLAADLARLVAAVLSSAPGVQILVTSQAVLHVPGEQVYRLDALQVPPHDAALSEACDCSAMQLFLQRARAADRHFGIDDGNLAAAIRLLRQLDGIPLAIEMAAARIPLLGLSGLSERLVEWSRLLRNSELAAPTRQQTLQATLQWSYSLLAPSEQKLLRRFSAFVGSVRIQTLQAALRDDELDDWGVIDEMTSLVDKSLVQVERSEPPRYRLLETMRLFARDQLEQCGETDLAVLRHAHAVAGLADEIEHAFWEMPERPWLLAHAHDYDDMQLAFDRACDRRDAEIAARVGIGLLRLDSLRSINAPRQQRAEALHSLLPLATDRARALIWSCIASHGLITLEVVSRIEASTHAVQWWRRLGDPARLHFALGHHAAECARVNDFDAADRALAEALAIEDPAWPLRRRMARVSAMAGVCIHRGDAAGYRGASRSELALAVRAGAERAAAWARLKLADAALMAGEFDEAIDLGRQAVAELGKLDQPSNLGLALSNLCAALVLSGDDAAGRDAAAQALPLMWRNGWGYLLVDSVALLAARNHDMQRAAQLLGHADRWYRTHRDGRQPNEATLARHCVAMLAADTHAQELAALRDAGQQLSDADAELLAQSALGMSAPQRVFDRL